MLDAGPRFELFGTAHLWTLAITFAVIVALPLALRGRAMTPLERALAVAMAVVMVLAEAAKVVMRAAGGERLLELIPLHLCTVAVFLAAALLLTRSFRAYELVYFWGLAATLPALFTPDLWWGFPHPYYVCYFLTHGLIVTTAIYGTVVFGFRPTPRSIVRVYVATVVYALAVVAPINWLLDTNYLYLCRKPYETTLFDYFGPWPWYIGVLAVLAWPLYGLCYLPFWIRDLRARRRAAAV